MKCKKCGAELLDTDHFCINCGMLVDVKIVNCPFCGEKLRDNEKFCHRCGSEIPVPGEEAAKVGTYPNGLNTTEISALSDAVIAAAQMELGEEAEEPEEPVRIKKPGKGAEAASYQRKKSSRQRRGGRVEDSQGTDDLLNKMILGAGMFFLVLVAVGLFLFSRNAGLVPGGNTDEKTQTADGKEEGKGKQERPEKPPGVTEKEEEEEIEEVPEGYVRVTAGTLNIRDGADTSGTQIIGKAKKGDVFPYLSMSDGWYYIQLEDGEGGYVSQDYVVEE